MKFDDKFRMKKTIILLIILQLFCYIGFLLISIDKKLLCSRIVKYIPPGLYVLYSFINRSISIIIILFIFFIYLFIYLFIYFFLIIIIYKLILI